MPDISKIKSKFSNVFQRSSVGYNQNYKKVWKPTAKHVVRILPNKFDVENPFTELKFHYKINGKTFLSPASFGKPDPIIEFSETLEEDGDKEQAKKFLPKPKYFAAVIVRGEEDKGIQYWGFSSKVLQDIVSLLGEEDFNDLYDLQKGVDLSITFLPTSVTKTIYTGIDIKPKRNSTPAFNGPSLMDTQLEIKDLFTLPSYEDIKRDLTEHLSPEEDVSSEVSLPEDDAPPFSSEPVVAPVTNTNKSPSALKSKENKNDDLAQFNELFATDDAK